MNKNLTLVFICILFNLQFVNAQKQTSQWYFSNNSALDFLSGVPVALTNSAMNQYEGSSSIADDNGNLFVLSARNNVFKINIESKVATFLGTISGLPIRSPS